jgi:hypothetical protein
MLVGFEVAKALDALPSRQPMRRWHAAIFHSTAED